MSWIVYCDGGVDYFETLEGAEEFAQDCIDGMHDDTWCEEVENIVIARVTHRTEKVNVVTADMLDEERTYQGKHYPGDCDYYCGYEMKPVEPEYRCNICGGVVRYDGTKPVPGCWGGRT